VPGARKADHELLDLPRIHHDPAVLRRVSPGVEIEQQEDNRPQRKKVDQRFAQKPHEMAPA
jgi:hypothetical protein